MALLALPDRWPCCPAGPVVPQEGPPRVSRRRICVWPYCFYQAQLAQLPSWAPGGIPQGIPQKDPPVYPPCGVGPVAKLVTPGDARSLASSSVWCRSQRRLYFWNFTM